MAQSTEYNLTSSVGSRESLSDELRRVNPSDAPLYSTLPHSEAPRATLVEWLNDDIPLPAFDSPLLDGTDVSFASDFTNELANRQRLGNRIQQFQRQGAVSPIAEAIDVAGPGTSLLAQSKARILTTLKTDIEAAIGGAGVSTASVSTGGSTKGSLMGGLFHFSDPSATTGVFDDSGKQAYRSVSGSRHNQDGAVDGALTEEKFRGVLEEIYTAGGKSQTYRLFAGPSLMNTLTSYSRAINVVGGTQARFNANISGTSLTLSVVEIVSDYGIVQVLPDLFLNRTSGAAPTTVSKRSGILIPADDNVSLKFMKGGISVQDLPDIGGGGERFLTRAILTLCVLNSRAIGSII